jgi:hypothetical protein
MVYPVQGLLTVQGRLNELRAHTDAQDNSADIIEDLPEYEAVFRQREARQIVRHLALDLCMTKHQGGCNESARSASSTPD